MEKKTTAGNASSRVGWADLEHWVRGQVQQLIQGILEEEVTEFLGRAKSVRRPSVEGLEEGAGYRNGHAKPRSLTLGAGTIQVRRPRVRNADDRFVSRVLPLFQHHTPQVRELLPQLYLHGLSEGDFDLALRGLLGEKAPLSASTVARLKEHWQGEFETWRRRSLKDLKVVYLWVDGVYVKAGLEKEKAAVLVALAALENGSKVVIAVEAGYRESTASWAGFLRDLKARGMAAPKVVIGDGHLGIWGGLREVYPEASEQRCWNHKVMNVLERLPKKAQTPGLALLRPIPYAETQTEAEKRRDAFVAWCKQRGYEAAGETLRRDWDRMVTFYCYPKAHWQHLRTSNPVESPFAALRLRTDAAKRYKKVDRATAMIWKLLLVGEQHFRRLKGPEWLPSVAHGTRFVDGKLAEEKVAQEIAA